MKTATLWTLASSYRLDDETGTALQSFPWRTLAERDAAKGTALRLAHALGFDRVEKKNARNQRKNAPASGQRAN